MKSLEKSLSLVNQRIENKRMIEQSGKQLYKEIDKLNDLVLRLEVELKTQLDGVSARLRRQIELVIKKLAIRLEKNIDLDFTYSHIPYQFEFGEAQNELLSAFRKIEDSMNRSMLDYLDELLSHNISKNTSTSILHTSNLITSNDSSWCSVTSKDPLIKCQIQVEGFNQITTTYFALGVTTGKKSYGSCKSLEKERFTGCIYLNGKSEYELGPKELGNYRKATLTQPAVKFVIEDSQRRLCISRNDSARKEVLLLGDNIDYYLYLAWKGPIKIRIK